MKIIKWVDAHFEETIICVLIAVISILVFLQIIMRSFVGHSLSFSDELCRYMFVWIGALGVSYATRLDKHLRMDILPVLFTRLAPALNMIADIGLFVMAVVLIKAGIPFLENIGLIGTHQESAAMRIPMTWVYSSFEVAFCLTIVRLFEKYVKKIYFAKRKGAFVEHGEAGENA